MKKKTCFVLIGYGIKTDYPTGRNLNLDNTFDGLIKPVFAELGIECFRAKDIIHSGIIDVPMYDWIYKADIVVADLSTLNPNVLYELGVRHSLKPYTTIVIAEDKLNKIPFDLSHLNIDPVYHHLGEDIGVQEAERFKKVLKEKVNVIINNPQNDSPVHTYLRGLKFTKDEVEEMKELQEEQKSLSGLIQEAEDAKNKSDFYNAIKLFKEAKKIKQGDVFLTQRLALVTYKNKKPDPVKALHRALSILKKLNPEMSTDPETLGLSGAIYKRLFEESKDKDIGYLEKAIWYYERGFFIKQDYYNGINVAFLYSKKSLLQKKKEEAITDNITANRIRKKVIGICERLINSKDFKQRGDKDWICFTIAEAYYALGNTNKMDEMIELGKKYSKGEFAFSSFSEQKEKLEKLLAKYKNKWNNI